MVPAVKPHTAGALQIRLLATHLELESLANQTDDVNEVGVLVQADLGRPIAPVPLAADVPGKAPLVAERLDWDVETQPQPSFLRNDVDEVGLGLESDVELEELLSDAWVQGQNLGTELLKQRSPRLPEQIWVVFDGEVRLCPLSFELRDGFSWQLR